MTHLESTAQKLREEHGPWENHEDYPREDWQREAAQNETSLGYWTWVANQMDIRGELREEPVPYTVAGYYIDNYQSFSHHVRAKSPAEAVRKTFEEIGSWTKEMEEEEHMLGELAEQLGMEPVSVTRGHHEELVGQANPAW